MNKKKIKQLKDAISTAILGGLVVILPSALLVTVFNWLYEKVTILISPITKIFWADPGLLANILTVLIILTVSFMLGVAVKTRSGNFFYNIIDKGFLSKVPGYSLIRDIVLQFIGKRKNSFSAVALVDIFNNSTRMTGFVTDRSTSGIVTVFVPTGPNPTSGNIYHLPADKVKELKCSVDVAMKSIIACGGGTSGFIDKV